MPIRPVLLALATVAIGAIIIALIPHFLDLAPSDDSSLTTPTQCSDTTLKSTTVDTTFSIWAGSEIPSFSSDTTFTVPKNWRGVDGLVSSPSDAKFRNAAWCFLPQDSQGYRSSPPTVSVDDSEQAKRKGQHLVGDHITLEDYVQSNANDPNFLPNDLGIWSLSYKELTTSACFDSQPQPMPHSYLLAVLCPTPGKARYGQWTIHLDLQGASIVSSSHRPVQYSDGTSATWKITNFGDTKGFWVELKPDRALGLYLAVQDWHSGIIPFVSQQIGWSVFFLLLFIVARRSYSATSYTRKSNEWNAAETLQGICICSLLAGALTIAADSMYALSSDKTSHAPYARIEAILVFGLVSTVGIQAWRRPWRKSPIIMAVIILGTLAYFGPERITIENGQTFRPSTANLNRWQLISYFNHLFIGVALVTVLIASALAIGKTASETAISSASETNVPSTGSTNSTLNVEPRGYGLSRSVRYVIAVLCGMAVVLQWLRIVIGKTASETAIPSTGLTNSTLKVEPRGYGLSRSVRYVIAVLCGMAVVLQWLRIAYDQWDHRRLLPGAPTSLESISAALLPRFPWFPDFFLHWLPALLFYPALICVFATLAQLARADTSWRGAIITSVPPARSLTILLFAVGVVGIYGSYRSIQVPIVFFVSLALMHVVIRRTDPLEEEIQRVKERENEVDLERLQLALLQNSRTEVETPQEQQAEDSGIIGAVRREWRRYWTGKATVAALQDRQDIAAGEEDQFSDQEIALALGPRIVWWRNAVYATKISALLAIPFIFYDGYLTFRNGVFSNFLQAFDGFFSILQWALSEILVWIAAGFTLGALWPLILGRRGVYKGLTLSIVVIASAGIDVFISHGFNQSTIDLVTRSVLILSFFEIVAIIIDVSTLKKVERERWEFIDYLRLRDTRWLAAYGAVAAIVAFTIFQQIRSGQPLINIPASVISGVLKSP